MTPSSSSSKSWRCNGSNKMYRCGAMIIMMTLAVKFASCWLSLRAQNLSNYVLDFVSLLQIGNVENSVDW